MANIEVFIAGCPLCDEAVRTVNETACPNCTVTVYDLRQGQGLRHQPCPRRRRGRQALLVLRRVEGQRRRSTSGGRWPGLAHGLVLRRVAPTRYPLLIGCAFDPLKVLTYPYRMCCRDPGKTRHAFSARHVRTFAAVGHQTGHKGQKERHRLLLQALLRRFAERVYLPRWPPWERRRFGLVSCR
jgi:hypothetical protein